MHAILVGAGLVVLALLGTPTEAWIGAGTAMLSIGGVVLCSAIYSRALARRPRSYERWTGDRRRGVTMLILAVPGALSVAAACIPGLRPTQTALAGHPITGLVACLAVVALAFLYLSSTIDWYIVKGWRDGIVTDPPCMRRQNRPTWLLMTRLWLLHRIFATVGFFVALWTGVGLAWFELYSHHGKSDWVIYLLGLASPSTIPLFLMRSYIASLGHAIGLAFGNLRISLGDRVSWHDDGQHSSGIVYDVSIDNGYRVIDHDGQTTYLSLARAREGNISIDETDPPAWACDAVRKSQLMGASDHWASREHPSAKWVVLR